MEALKIWWYRRSVERAAKRYEKALADWKNCRITRKEAHVYGKDLVKKQIRLDRALKEAYL